MGVTRLYTQTTSGAIVNSATSGSLFTTGVGNRVIEGSSLGVGDQIRIRAFGWGVQSAAPTLRFSLYANEVQLNEAPASDPSFSTVPSRWVYDAIITIRSIGAAGTVSAQVEFSRISNTGSIESAFAQVDLGTKTINTTVTNVIEVMARWGIALELNKLVCSDIMIEKISG